MYIDNTSKIGVMLDEKKHRLNEGNMFVLSDNATLAANATRTYFLTTSGTKSTDLLINLNAWGHSKIEIYESPNFTTSGLTSGVASISGGSNSSSFTYNQNRRKAGITPSSTISAEPVIYTTSGTLIFASNSISGSYNPDKEFALAYNTNYLVKITGVGTSNNTTWNLNLTEV